MSNRRKPNNPGAVPQAFNEDLLIACANMLPRLGAKSIESRYSEPEHNGAPVVWLAIAELAGGRFETGAALDPARAAFRLLEHLVDGGVCTHCSRPTGITEDFAAQLVPELVCWYQFDPELKTFRRGCE